MRGIYTKIRYMLETIGVCCNSVDLRQVNERQDYWYRLILIPIYTGEYWPIPV